MYYTLGIVGAEEPVVLQRPAVPGANRFHALSGDMLEFFKLAIVNLEPGYALNFAHRFCLWEVFSSTMERYGGERRLTLRFSHKLMQLEDFFALWKDADPDLPILIEAKKEYQKLR